MKDYQEEHRKRLSRMRSIMDYGMGSILVLIGLWFLVYEKMDINFFRREPSSIDYFIGALFIVYGIWRIYRGYKKNYFR